MSFSKPFDAGDGLTDLKLFLFDQSAGKKNVLSAAEYNISPTDREAQRSTFCILYSPTRLSLQRRETLHKAILGLYEERAELLSYSNTPELLSKLTDLRRCECPMEFYPTQHCNSSF